MATSVELDGGADSNMDYDDTDLLHSYEEEQEAEQLLHVRGEKHASLEATLEGEKKLNRGCPRKFWFRAFGTTNHSFFPLFFL